MMVELSARPEEPVSDAAIQYMNRLSDFLFVASRAANYNGAGDVLWVPGQNR
jgi:cob(I)alamin adenosyltransferase